MALLVAHLAFARRSRGAWSLDFSPPPLTQAGWDEEIITDWDEGECVENASQNKRVFELSLQGETLQVWKAYTGRPNPGYPFFERWFWICGICVMGDRLILRQGDSQTKELVALYLS